MTFAHITKNETSFAVAYMDATTLLLDGLALTGEARADQFDRAKHRARAAIQHTDAPEEEALARQILAYIQVSELQHWNV